MSFVSRALSFDPHSTPSLLFSILLSSTLPTLSGSCSTSSQPRTCADPHSLRGDGFAESEPRTSYEPKIVGNKMVGDKTVVDTFTPIVTEQEGAHSTEDHKHYSDSRKLRISSHYHTTSHCCLRPKVPLKALLRLKKQTYKFVLCWLHNCTCRSEKQVRNDHKFITPKEKVCCQVHRHGSHIGKDWDKTNFQKESNLLMF